MRDRIYEAICTAGFLGKVPRAPGTAGTLAGVAIYLACPHPAVIGGVALLLALVGVGLTPWAQRRFGREDPPEVVIDEVAGYLLSVIVLVEGLSPLVTAGLGFSLFRFFDIVKPPPVGWVDRSKCRWALVGDDLVAGLLASLCLNGIALVAGGSRA